MYTKIFKNLSGKDTKIAGGKGASLGEMLNSGINVPNGFVVITTSFDTFIEKNNLKNKIEQELSIVNIDIPSSTEQASKNIQNLIFKSNIPNNVEQEIFKEFDILNSKYVAVRSSATLEDGVENAWAGQLDSFLNTSKQDLIQNIKKCFASLFTPRAIFYRFESRLEKSSVSVAVVVQKMVASEKSGIAFSVHPISQDKNQIIIEGGFGLGEAVVSGSITPDSYIVNKQTKKITSKVINKQEKGLYRDENGLNIWKDTSNIGNIQTLTDLEILKLSETIIKIENHYKLPQDIEWAIEDGEIYITQSRPITTLEKENGIEWEKIVSRNIPILGWSAGAYYENKGLNIGKITWKRNREIIVKNNTKLAHVIFDMNDTHLTNLSDIITSIDINFEKELDSIISFIENIFSMNDITNTTDFLQINEYHSKYFGYMLMGYDIIWDIKEKIFEEIESQNGLEQYILSPYKKTLVQIENEEINKSIMQYQNNAGLLEKLSKELEQKFGFIHSDYMGEEWCSDKYEKLIKKGDLKVISEIEKFNEEKLNDYQKWLINISRKIVFMFEQGRNAMVKSVGLMKKYATIVGIEKKQLLNYTYLELKDFITNKTLVNNNDLKLREKYFAIYFDKGDINYIYKKNDIKTLLDKEKIDELESSLVGVKTIKGMIAQKGKVRGNVRLVYNQDDAGKIKSGDVLVSTMTAVEFLHGIRNASAIVTDEGSVICHAAIISRELSIPCIIGTKIATQTLKNGDYIEVDANKGIITILK